MSWTKKSEGQIEYANGLGQPQYDVLTETITSVQGRAKYSGEFSVPPGVDFAVIANYAKTNLSASTHVELFFSDVSGGTFLRHPNTTYFNATTGAIDTLTPTLLRDVSVTGQAPVYKLKIPSGGGSVKCVVLVGG